MTKYKSKEQIIDENRMIIFEMISSSIELSETLGKHPLTKGCNCVSCINKRKRIIKTLKNNWRFSL